MKGGPKKMEETFRLKIEGNHKTTIPQHLLNQLRLREGDEIRIITEDRKLLRVEARQNTNKGHQRSVAEQAELVKRIEAVKAGDHDSEEDLFRALQTVSRSVGLG